MNVEQTIASLESRARAAGLTLTEMAQRAGIAPITFRRWRSGDHSPTFSALAKVERVVAQAERENGATNGQ